MPSLNNLKSVDIDYIFNSSYTTTMRQVIQKPAASVFASFEDGPAWKEWIGIEVEWTSTKPYGVGTTRTVTNGPVQIDERFIVWEAPLRMAFYAERASLPFITAFAEDYHLTPLDDHSCELAWTFAYDWGGPFPGLTGGLFGRIFAFMGQRSLQKLADMMASTDRFDP